MSDKNYDILCIGTAIVDSIITGFDPQRISASGYRAGSCSLKAGGEAVNESIAAARLGMKTAVMCFLGQDAAGDMIRSVLEKNGVDTGMIVTETEHATPVTTIFTNNDGSRQSITNTAHRYNFHPERYADRINHASAITLASLFRAPFNDPEIIYSVVSTAAAGGQMVFADTKLPNFNVLTLQDLSDSLPFIDYITPNRDEAEYYSKKKVPEDMADAFLDLGVKNVIIKLGAEGCLLKNAKETIRFPGYDVMAVDSTGAGDVFLAGFVSAKLSGSADADALAFANACGAICTTAVGADGALKDRGQVLSFMADR